MYHKIKCIGIHTGLLDPPSNVTMDFKNETIIHLSWLPPFSLKDILGYVVTVSPVDSSILNEVSDEVQTTLIPEFTYSWSSSLGYCRNRFIFEIAALNNLGASNKTSGIVAGFLRCKLKNLCLVPDNNLNTSIRHHFNRWGGDTKGAELYPTLHCLIKLN